MRLNHRRAAVAGIVALSVTGCNAILGLGNYFNECGGPLDAPCNNDGGGGNATTSGTASGGSGGSGSGAGPSGPGGAGGSGGAMACTPGDVKKGCYDGPDGTKNTGVCVAGQQTCNKDGTAFGDCVMEVVPTDELCSNTADENCDGLDCVIWSQDASQGASLGFFTTAVYDATAKEFVMVGGFGNGAFHVGGKTINPSEEFDGFLARVGPDGTASLLKPFGTPDNDRLIGLAIDSLGAMYVTGTSNGTIDIGGVNLGPGGFLARLDATGSPVWGQTYGTGVTPWSVSVTQNDDLVVSGTFSSSINLGAGAVTGPGIFVARVSKADGTGPGTFPGSGGHWGQTGTMTATPTRMFSAVDANDNVLIAGDVTGTLNMFGIPFTASAGGGRNLFVGKLTSAGDRANVEVFGGTGNDAIVSFALDPVQGTTAIAATLGAPVVFDEGRPNETTIDPAGGETVLALLGNTQRLQWSHQYFGLGNAPGLAIDAQSELVFFGGYGQRIDFGVHPITAGANGAFGLLKLDKTGKVLWSRSYDTTATGGNPLLSPAAAVDASGSIFVGGNSGTAIDLGAGSIPAGNMLPTSFLAHFGR